MSLYIGENKMNLHIGKTKVKLNALNGDYIISDGKLVWANPNLYLASNQGSSFVKTDFRPTTNTTVIADWKILGEIKNGNNTRNYLFSSKGHYYGTNSFAAIWWVNDSGTNFFWPYIGNTGSGAVVSAFSNEFKYRAIMNGSGSQYLYNLTTGALIKSWGTNYSFSGATSDFYILKKLDGYTCPNITAINTLKILENEELVYHFVPVPAGLQIGSFTVPSNGMWDIVTQQFFGNSGTGEFSYGRDE